MRIVIIVLLIVGVCGNRKTKEVDLEKFHATFDPEITVYSAKNFTFPKEKGLDLKKTPECGYFKKFPKPKDSCPAPKGIGYSGDLVSDCKEQKCIQKSFYGSTKCRKMVRLFKPFPHFAVECKKMYASCKLVKPHGDKELYPDNSNNGKPHLYPEQTKDEEPHLYPEPEKDEDGEENSCECFTIWCFRDIHTIYEEQGNLYKGNVAIKTPCGCDCRNAHKVHHYGGYDSGGK